MDSINPNTHLTPSQFGYLQANQPTELGLSKKSSHIDSKQMIPQSIPKTEKVDTFANLFGDDQLSRLHDNLETIASMAEEALNRIANKNN